MEQINLYKLLTYYLKHWYIIVGFMLVGLSAGHYYNTYIQKPSYKSDATMFVANTGDAAVSKDSALINNYIEIMKSRRVLEPVIDELKLDLSYDQIAGSLSVNNQKDTAVIKITVVTGNPATSKSIADSIVISFKKQIENLYGKEDIKIVDNASTSELPNNVNTTI